MDSNLPTKINFKGGLEAVCIGYVCDVTIKFSLSDVVISGIVYSLQTTHDAYRSSVTINGNVINA